MGIGRVVDPVEKEGPDQAVHPGRGPGGGAMLQLGLEQLANYVVKVETESATPNVRAGLEPVEDLLGSTGDRIAEQVHGGPGSRRADRQPGAMVVVRDVVDDQRAEPTDGIRGVGQLGRPSPAAIDLGQHGESERVSAAQVGEPCGLVGHAQCRQEPTACGVVETAQRMHVEQLPPTGIQPPIRTGFVATGKHGDGVGGAGRSSSGTQPTIQWLESSS